MFQEQTPLKTLKNLSHTARERFDTFILAGVSNYARFMTKQAGFGKV
jgi:hypothetical protein